jgi:hypothetical protein
MLSTGPVAYRVEIERARRFSRREPGRRARFSGDGVVRACPVRLTSRYEHACGACAPLLSGRRNQASAETLGAAWGGHSDLESPGEGDPIFEGIVHSGGTVARMHERPGRSRGAEAAM